MSHKAIVVNGEAINVPSYAVKASDVVAVREKSRNQARIQQSLELAKSRGFADWIDVDTGKMSGVFKRVPDRADLPADINESLVVELYSK